MNRREFIKNTGKVLALGFLPNLSCLSGCSVFQDNVDNNFSLENIIHRKYNINEGRARKNNQYLIDNLKNRSDVTSCLRNQDQTKIDLEKKLISLEHCKYREPSFDIGYGAVGAIHNGPEDVCQLTSRQLVRVYLMLDALENEDFRKQIMKEIDLDFQDPQVKQGYLAAERGGLIKINNGKLELFPVLSKDALKKREDADKPGNYSNNVNSGSNFVYIMPKETLEKERFIFDYHIHATKEDDTNSCGPSFSLLDAIFGRITGDIGYCSENIMKFGESHHLVITKLKGNEFNVGYFGGEKDKKGKPKIIVLSLGNWEG